jgi:pescadillo protein
MATACHAHSVAEESLLIDQRCLLSGRGYGPKHQLACALSIYPECKSCPARPCFINLNELLQIPPDVDLRVMLTFLELYQTLLGFVFFKLYTDAGLVYPPPLDAKKDEGAAGVGAFNVQDASPKIAPHITKKVSDVHGKKISSKDVRETIRSIAADTVEPAGADVVVAAEELDPADAHEEFVHHPSSKDPQESSSLPTLQYLSSLPVSPITNLFSPCTFFLSRETSRSIFEFLVRCFGGRIGWAASTGTGSPFDDMDDSITHVIIDRPLPKKAIETPEEKERRLRRKYVQPQWVVDCINAGKILLEEPYGQGRTLPPHLSPFGEYEGAYDPTVGLNGETVPPTCESAAEDGEEEEEMEERESEQRSERTALKAAATAATDDATALRNAELAAEAAGVDYGTFEKEVRKSHKRAKQAATAESDGDDMNKMLMSNKQRKLYERIKHSKQKRADEVCLRFYLRCDCSSKLAPVASKNREKKARYREGEKDSSKKDAINVCSSIAN